MMKGKNTLSILHLPAIVLTFLSIIKPYRVDITGAKTMIERVTSSKVIDTQPGKIYVLDD